MEHTEKQNRLLRTIIVLTLLLILTSTALAGVVIYKYIKANQSVPATIPNNIITEQEQTSAERPLRMTKYAFANTLSAFPIIVEQDSGKTIALKIYRNHAEDSTPFYANNLFPGDAVSKHFDVQVSYKGSVTVNFHADIRSGYEKLAEVLKCKISLSDGNVLYDGLMRDMPKAVEHTLPQSTGTTADLGYDMDVYLDTSVGNEYQNKTLIADFRWWVEEGSETTESTEESETTETTDSTESTRPSEDDADDTSEETSETENVPSGGGSLIHPTGDTTKLLLWIGLAGVSLVLILFLILIGRNKKEDTAYD